MEHQRSHKRWRRALVALWEPWARWTVGAAVDLDLEGVVVCPGLTVVQSRNVVDDIIRYVV